VAKKKLCSVWARKFPAAVLSALLLFGILPVFGNLTAIATTEFIPVTAEQRQAIADYALDQVLNPAQKRGLSLAGGDCVSFSSNALLAAGISFDTQSSGHKWYNYDNNGSAHSGSWNTTSEMFNYLSSHETDIGTGLVVQRIFGAGSGSLYTALNVRLEPGDIVLFRNTSASSSFPHTAIVVGGGSSASAVVTANHSRNTLMTLEYWARDSYPTANTYIIVYRVSGYHNPTGGTGQFDIPPATYKSGSNYLALTSTVSMHGDKNIFGDSYANIQKVIAVQPYDVSRVMGNGAVGYCSDFGKVYNGQGVFGGGSAVTEQKILRVLSTGFGSSNVTAAEFNSRLRLTGGNALTNEQEMYYATQMALWYANGDLQRRTGGLTWNGDNVVNAPNYSDARTYNGITPALEGGNPGSSRVYAAAMALCDIADNTGMTVSPTAPTLTLTPPSPNKAVYNAVLNDFLAGPYTVSCTGATSYDTSFSGNTASAETGSWDGATWTAKITFNIGESFYVRIPKTAGQGSFDVRAQATVSVSTVRRFDAINNSTTQQGVYGSGGGFDETRGVQPLEFETFGKLSVHKVSDKGEDMPGVTFGVYTTSGCTALVKDPNANRDVVLVTGADGLAVSPDLMPGAYYVKERDMTIGQYELFNMPDAVYAVEVVGGVTTAVNGSTVVNRYKTVEIQITKTNANPALGDYSLAGTEFQIRNTTTGESWTVYTNSSGFVNKPGLPLGQYEVQEITAPNGYRRNPSILDFDLSKGEKGTAVVIQPAAFAEEPQAGTITVTKADIETGARAQGDGTLNAAAFEIYAKEAVIFYGGTVKYAKDELVDTLICGADSTSATSAELPLGTYYVKEKTAPTGYNLATRTYDVTIYYHDQNVRVHAYNRRFDDDVIKGKIGIVKHGDEPSSDPALTEPHPNLENPLEGIQFKVWLKSAGSYDAALATERDIITTDENGFAETKNLPYGLYRAEELDTPANTELEKINPFEVFIGTNGKTYWYIVRDDTPTAYLRIIKTDSETGNTIPLAGATFKIQKPDGTFVSQQIMYPTPSVIDEFITDVTGMLMMPQALPGGNYSVVEVQAPYGYILEPSPIPVHIGPDSPETVEIVYANTPAKGTVTVTKQGYMLTGATRTGDLYTPVYTLRGLTGAVFNIIATRDIITPDGTIRFAAGEVVDTVTTGAQGTATSKALYLGAYYAVEITAPGEMVIDAGQIDFELLYAGQHTPIVAEFLTVDNVRQQVNIRFLKLMEHPVNAPENFNPFEGVVFGLYAAEDIFAVDGSPAIPKNGLVATAAVDETGAGRFAGDLPFADYYVREISTNPAYLLDDTPYNISAAYRGQDAPVCEVTVNNGGRIVNETKPGVITVQKWGDALTGAAETDTPYGKQYRPEFTRSPLAGVTYNIVADEDIFDVYGRLLISVGTVVDTVTTGANGTATSRELHFGRYVLTEIDCPAGFVLDTSPIPAVLGVAGLTADNTVVTAVEQNDRRQKVRLNITKTFADPNNEDANKAAGFANVVFGVFTASDITAVDGSVIILADALVYLITPDENGGASPVFDAVFGCFYVKELATDPLYLPSDTAYPFEVTAQDSDIEIADISINGGRPIVNEPIPRPPAFTYESPENPKTGNGGNVPLWPAIPVLFAGGLFLGVRKRKKW
jgi:hypothetical protein